MEGVKAPAIDVVSLYKVRKIFLLNVLILFVVVDTVWSGEGNIYIIYGMMLQSIVMPVHNGSRWLDDCLTSIFSQAGFTGSLELSVYNDASTVGFYFVYAALSNP